MSELATKVDFDYTAGTPSTGGVLAREGTDGGSPTAKEWFEVLAATGTRPGVMPLSTINEQTGASYAIDVTDLQKLALLTHASAVAATIAAATTSGFGAGFTFALKCGGAGTVTLTPTTSTINGAATLVLITGQWALIWSDGTNYFALISSAGSSTGITQTAFTSSSSAGDGRFTVSHGLGYSPTAAVIIGTAGTSALGIVNFQDSTLWDATNFYLIGSDVGLTGFVVAWK